VHQRLNDLEQLGQNWDGYGAPAIRGVLIATAREIASRLAEHDVPRPHVVPLSSGALQFEWRDQRNRVLELEIEGPETIHYLRWDPDAGIEDENYIHTADENGLRSLTDWFIHTVRLIDPR
jgi:hypothetical protein